MMTCHRCTIAGCGNGVYIDAPRNARSPASTEISSKERHHGEAKANKESKTIKTKATDFVQIFAHAKLKLSSVHDASVFVRLLVDQNNIK